jgi:SpoIID/LytB domain protein
LEIPKPALVGDRIFVNRLNLSSRIVRPVGAQISNRVNNPGLTPGATFFRPLRGLVEKCLPTSPRWRAVLMLSAALVSLSGSPWKRIASNPAVVSENEIDASLQQAATAALGQGEGAIIVMDPQTGRVRAVVNPQVAFSEAVMPGSTMKPFTALAALRSGLIDTNSRTVCPGRFTGLSFSVACVHDNKLPPFTPSQAIAYSCNYYFGTLGERLGREKLIAELRTFGFGQPTGLSEERGKLLPCEAGNNAKVRSGEKAQADCNAREAIGESDHFTVTPIQLLAAYAALVNGGRVFEPRVASADGFDPVERGGVDIAPQHRAIITEGMKGAVRYGTAKSAHLDSVSLSIIGKTGTSLPAKGFRTNGWFVGFASPARTPAYQESEPAPSEVELAVLIFLPRSHGAEAAAVAKPIFETFANETNGVHRRVAEERREGAEKSFDNLATRSPQSAIRVHLVTENVTQELSLEDYVLGVMRAEGTMESEPEALKALAIAIRTYALKNRGRHAKDGYDFCTTTHCQRFLGGDPTVRDGAGTLPDGRVSAAVRATEGQILADDHGQPVDTYFGASCGGETANIATLWGTRPSQYLSGVRDEYCVSGPHATWTDVITRADLLRTLQSDPRTNVGARLDQVVISKRDDTGRAEFITLDGEHRKQLRGWDFKIIVGRVLGWNVLKSSRFEVARVGSNFIFHGKGFGHGLGLCQEGAHVMAARGSSYQRILEKYFPGARVKPRSGNVSLARPFKAGNEAENERFVASATIEPRPIQPSLTRRTGWRADLYPALKGRAKVTGRYAAVSFSAVRFLSISSEHFRVTYPADVDRPDANLVLNTLESARGDFLHRASAASLSIDVPVLEIRINVSTGDFTARSGEPWWAAAATKGTHVELQPVGILKRRGALTTTLRHELAHVVIDAVSHNHTPRWLGEGFAIYLAGEGPMFARYVTKTKLSPDEIEKRLERPGSQQEMRMLYALAYNQVIQLIRLGSEASVWKKLATG